MILSSRSFFALAYGASLLLALIAPPSVGAVPVNPIDYRVGPVPVPYQPAIFPNYPSTPGSIPDITDSSLLTFTKLDGRDNVLQSNGSRVDTGTFYLLQFQIDPTAAGFAINFTARIDAYPTTPFGDFVIEALSADGLSSRTVYDKVSARQPTTFGLTFFRATNAGNRTNQDSINWGLNDMLAPDGKLRIVLQGGFLATANQTGHLTSYLYDVNAAYAVPEPHLLSILLAGALCRRRVTRG